jgi:hypothetical protein
VDDEGLEPHLVAGFEVEQAYVLERPKPLLERRALRIDLEQLDDEPRAAAVHDVLTAW